MIVGLVGEAVVIAEDIHPLIPPLFLSPDNIYQPNDLSKENLVPYSECPYINQVNLFEKTYHYNRIKISSSNLNTCLPSSHLYVQQ